MQGILVKDTTVTPAQVNFITAGPMAKAISNACERIYGAKSEKMSTIQNYAKSYVSDHSGETFEVDKFNKVVDTTAEICHSFEKLTPYQYHKLIIDLNAANGVAAGC